LRCQAQDLDMMPDAFDDQYLCCRDDMEREAPKILQQEKRHSQFAALWDTAWRYWQTEKGGLVLPEKFRDEYGTAVALYTMASPIYSQLNRNVSIAGRSRDYYMNNFHFKALHFYLTRALQVLGKGCAQRYQVYRGITRTSNVHNRYRYGQFTSSSLSYNVAQRFGTATFFQMSTCFGASIADISYHKNEQEVLIPVAETFNKIKQTGNTYEVTSTGQLCSYYDCAYLGGECDITEYPWALSVMSLSVPRRLCKCGMSSRSVAGATEIEDATLEVQQDEEDICVADNQC
ncbi:ecto-ADP-ribosyltransferase 5-like, partial [Pseudophryne corroboree]|uniref:ecto-ADP-ribosyltransferase 5-like n=1 Tax=Pseudophryne corroboree TaxID=495146 RepID=UPI003081D79B